MHFRMLRYAEKPWRRQNTNFLWCNMSIFFTSVFYSSEDYQEFNMAKSKLIAFIKIARNWGGFPLQTNYLVKKLFYMLSSSCCTFYICLGLVAW